MIDEKNHKSDSEQQEEGGGEGTSGGIHEPTEDDQPEAQNRSIPIGVPVSKEEWDELKSSAEEPAGNEEE